MYHSTEQQQQKKALARQQALRWEAASRSVQQAGHVSETGLEKAQWGWWCPWASVLGASLHLSRQPLASSHLPKTSRQSLL